MKNGKYIECDGEVTRYYKNDEYHREDGPAIEWISGSQYWFRDGKRHRLGGPAISHKLHTRFDLYWIDGESFTEQEFIKFKILLYLL